MKCLPYVLILMIFLAGCTTQKTAKEYLILGNHHAKMKDAENLQKAKEYLDAACNGGISEACLSLAKMWYDGNRISKSNDIGRIYLNKACDLGEDSACQQLGNMWIEGRTVYQDYFTAIGYFDKLCKRKHAKSCTFLYKTFSQGLEGIDVDYVKAREYSEMACDAGDAAVCYNLGNVLYRKNGDTDEVEKSLSYFENACHEGHAIGCFTAAEILSKNSDMKAAKQFYRFACEKGHGPGCFTLALFYSKGMGGVKDADKAKKYYEEACKRGDQRASAIIDRPDKECSE